MVTDTEMLNFIYKGTEMGISSIESVLHQVEDTHLYNVLATQREEYKKMFNESSELLQERGCKPKGLGVVEKASSEIMTTAKTFLDHSPSKIAEMIIQGSTMGVTSGLKNLHDYTQGDSCVQTLASRFVDTAQANIDQMKIFL